MLTGLQKAKALKQLRQLRTDKANLSGLALAKALKEIKSLRTELGMGNDPAAKGLLSEQLKPLNLASDVSEKQALTDWLKQLQGKSVVTVDGKLVRFNRNHSVDHLVHDAIYARKITLKAVEKVVEVFESGEFIGRDKLHKARADQFVAFHTYEKWVTLDEGQVRIRAKAGELENGLLEAGNGLIAYTAKSSFDGIKNASPIPHRLTGMRLQGEATDIGIYDKASTENNQDTDYVFVEIVEIVANEQSIENGPKQSNPFLQAVINGDIELSLKSLQDLLAEVQKDPQDPDALNAVQIMYRQFTAAGMVLDNGAFDSVYPISMGFMSRQRFIPEHEFG